MLIGLSGYARSGKDSVGDNFVEEFGFERASFAAVMKKMALAIDPWVAPSLRLHELVQHDGWEEAKKWPEVRRFLQRLGTEGGRRCLGEDVWVDALMKKLEHKVDYVITDVRFENEANAIVMGHGEVWRIERPGIDAANAHVSEHAIDDWPFDLVVANDGTLEDLRTTVLKALKSVRVGPIPAA